MFWKITYCFVDSETMKYTHKTLYFYNDKTYFDVEKYLKENNIFKYKLDVVKEEEIEDFENINKI